MPFESVTTIANYEGHLKKLVVRMKSRNGQVPARQLGNWLAQIVSERQFESELPEIDYVTPMPSHWTRELRRGFNVADILVDSLCETPRLSGKRAHLLSAARKTKKQGTLTMAQRFKNVKDCFFVSPKHALCGASILLVDDVMTSGATAIQAANALLAADVAQVHLAIVARGIGRQY